MDLCRACMRKAEPGISVLTDDRLKEVICQLETLCDPSDLPPMMCMSCVATVENWILFKNRCGKAHDLFVKLSKLDTCQSSSTTINPLLISPPIPVQSESALPQSNMSTIPQLDEPVENILSSVSISHPNKSVQSQLSIDLSPSLSNRSTASDVLNYCTSSQPLMATYHNVNSPFHGDDESDKSTASDVSTESDVSTTSDVSAISFISTEIRPNVDISPSMSEISTTVALPTTNQPVVLVQRQPSIPLPSQSTVSDVSIQSTPTIHQPFSSNSLIPYVPAQHNLTLTSESSTYRYPTLDQPHHDISTSNQANISTLQQSVSMQNKVESNIKSSLYSHFSLRDLSVNITRLDQNTIDKFTIHNTSKSNTPLRTLKVILENYNIRLTKNGTTVNVKRLAMLKLHRTQRKRTIQARRLKLISAQISTALVLKNRLRNVVKDTTSHDKEKRNTATENTKQNTTSNTNRKTTTTRKLKCNNCNYSTTNNHRLNIHISQYCKSKLRIPSTNSISHKCYLCTKKFTFKTLLVTHLQQVHKLLRPYKCEYCDLSYTSRGGLYHHHVVLHSTLQQAKCKLCSKRFQTKYMLLRHQKAYHSKLYVRKYSKEFNKISQFNPYKCPQCLCSYTLQHNLTRHVKQMHKAVTNSYTFKCYRPTCYETFKCKNDLLIHLQRHLYKCSKCQCSFTNKYKLIQHVRLKHNSVSDILKCKKCNRVFKCKSNLIQHNKYFHRIKKLIKFKCKNCYRVFNTKAMVLNHNEQVHVKCKFKCNECSKVFKSKPALQYHIKHIACK